MASSSGGSRFFSVVVILLIGGVAIYVAWSLRSYTEPAQAKEAPGVAAMLQAASGANIDALRAALKAGGDANARQIQSGPEEGMTALMYAARAGQIAIVKALIDEHATVNAQAKDGRTALMYAAMSDEPAAARVLIEAQANVDARDEQGVTALMLAAGRGRMEAVEAILRQGANTEFRNKWGDTALLFAARTGSLEKVKAILDAGAVVDAGNQSGQTALWLAFEPEELDLAIIELLLARGARVNQTDTVGGVTPLMRAAWRGHAASAAALLKAGADTKIRDREGLTVREWAANRGDDQGKAILALLDPAPTAPAPPTRQNP